MEADVLRIDAARAASQAKVAALREKLAKLPATEVAPRRRAIQMKAPTTCGANSTISAYRKRKRPPATPTSTPKCGNCGKGTPRPSNFWPPRNRPENTSAPRPDDSIRRRSCALLAEEPALVALQAQAVALRAQLADMQRGLVQINENQRRIVKLQREVALDEANYRKYAISLEQSRIDTALEDQRISNISIVQAASYDPKPISPHVALNLALGLLVGLCGGVGLALALEHFARPLRSPEDIERDLSLPTLATIPRFTQEQAAIVVRK